MHITFDHVLSDFKFTNFNSNHLARSLIKFTILTQLFIENLVQFGDGYIL